MTYRMRDRRIGYIEVHEDFLALDNLVARRLMSKIVVLAMVSP